MWRDARWIDEINGETDSLVEFLGLKGLEDTEVSSLSYGGQRLMEIGIALAARPRFLLLDEPLVGLAAQERERIVGDRLEPGAGKLSWTDTFPALPTTASGRLRRQPAAQLGHGALRRRRRARTRRVPDRPRHRVPWLRQDDLAVGHRGRASTARQVVAVVCRQVRLFR